MADNQTDTKVILESLRFKQLFDMLDLIPGLIFWVKDKNGKFIYINKKFVEHVGKKNENQILGLTDYDLSPKHIADQFAFDDKNVLNGIEVTERLEVNISAKGKLAWFTTSKRALYDAHNNVVGTYGVSRHLQDAKNEMAGMEALQKPTDFIRLNYANHFTIESLAEHCHLSVSALERRFKKYLGKTPLQFINEVRLEHARQLLIDTDKPISVIAYECGFPDNSYFTKQFSHIFGEVPSEFRKKFYKDKELVTSNAT